MIEEKQVLKIAKLSKLALSADEIKEHQKGLGEILEYVETLKEVNTDTVEAMTHPIALTQVFREDKVGAILTQDEVLSNAPEKREKKFSVPKVIGDN